MVNIILKIYAYLKNRKKIGIISFLLITFLLIGLVLRLDYKEDISDFMPLNSNHQNGLKVYQEISGANKIFVIFQYHKAQKPNPEEMVSAIEHFADEIEKRDSNGIAKKMTTQIDMEKMAEITNFVYSNIPYFLTSADYKRIDSLLTTPNYVAHQLQADKQMLMFPAGNLLSENIRRDPLNLFTPIVAKLQQVQEGINYELYDGYIFSPDMKRAIVIIDSPFGASETERNAQLITLLKISAESIVTTFPNIETHITGGPVIAVGNASQIKSDSILSVTLAIILILCLLFLSFRNIRNLLLIALSVGWGWLFAMGSLALVHDNVSIIVIGISSVILGIAVNYPLHFIAHLSHTTSIRTALKEISVPLIIGNITTVGAFLTLIPLHSIALRDLGLFSSFLLIGTILFVLIYLPHVVKPSSYATCSFINKMGTSSFENKHWLVPIILVLTIIFGYFSLHTKFDADMSHLNYITNEQKADIAYFQHIMQRDSNSEKVYVVSTDTSIDSTLDKSQRLQSRFHELIKAKLINSHLSCTQFLCSQTEQEQRLYLWHDFINRHSETICRALTEYSVKEGFIPGSFNDFLSILDKHYHKRPISDFDLLAHSVFTGYLSIDSIGNKYNVIDILDVHPQYISTVEQTLNSSNIYSFDVKSMNSAIANHLSSDFNYIGWACGLLVFFFLWFSFGSIELAMLSFLPMAFSWIWILGIMSILGIQFNIVNVILATFIFGQGDDYTIFITEGSCYEYAYRQKILNSYKNSIIISALIMFIGIGSLILAKHPALHSLAEVTIIGMFSVVLMAYIFPPLIYGWLVRIKGQYRRRPLSLYPLLLMLTSTTVFFLQLLTVHIIGFVLFVLFHPTERSKSFFHRYVHHLFRFDIKHIPSVRFHFKNLTNENFCIPSLLISNHQSMLDAAIFMAISPKILLIANENASLNWVIKKVFEWLDFITISEEYPINLELLKIYQAKGYSFVIFPEGERNATSSILRFHKGAFYIAEQLGLDIIPVLLHGLNEILPRNSMAVFSGTITVKVNNRIKSSDISWGKGYLERTKKFHRYYVEEYHALTAFIENAQYFSRLVKDRYLYKGVDVTRTVSKNLSRYDNYSQWIDKPIETGHVIVLNNGFGEFTLLYALVHPNVMVVAVEADEAVATLAQYSAIGLVGNVQTVSSVDHPSVQKLIGNAKVFLLHPSEEDKSFFSKYHPTIID